MRDVLELDENAEAVIESRARVNGDVKEWLYRTQYGVRFLKIVLLVVKQKSTGKEGPAVRRSLYVEF